MSDSSSDEDERPAYRTLHLPYGGAQTPSPQDSHKSGFSPTKPAHAARTASSASSSPAKGTAAKSPTRGMSTKAMSSTRLGATSGAGVSPNRTGGGLEQQGLETRFPLHAAAVAGDVGKVRALLGLVPEVRGIRLNADDQDDQGRTALHYAAEMGHVEVCRVLLSVAGEIISHKAKGLFGSTALHTAAANGQREAVEFLIWHDADVMLKNDNGSTPLHVAAGLGDVAMCRTLLDANSPVDAFANDGRTPLHVAVQNGHRSVAGLLINYGCDVNAKTLRNENALHKAVAAPTSHPDTVRWLLERGCDPDLERDDSKRPLAMLCEMIADAALLEFQHEEPYWVPEEVFMPEVDLSDPLIALRKKEGGASVVVAAAGSKVDVAALMAKFGISHDDLAKVRLEMGRGKGE